MVGNSKYDEVLKTILSKKNELNYTEEDVFIPDMVALNP